MSIEQNTGKPARLSLSERAKQGLLLLEPELALGDLLQLEHPGDPAARMALLMAIKAAIAYGDLAASIRQWERPGLTVNRDWLRLPPLQHKPTQCSEHLLERETYRQWRAQCPANLLSPLTKIQKWLGATPPDESIPPVETSLPESLERAIALVEAENAALVALRKALKREPDFEEFWDYLTTQDETGTVADCTDNRLDWIGHAGKSCSTAKSTIRNRLTAAKKRNPFTPS